MTTADNIPWQTVPSDLGDVPFYVIQFDKDGVCTSPAALDHLVETSKSKTDVFVFSHGWNNDWESATDRYDRFVNEFVAVRRQHWNPPTREFAPVLAGVFWPSTALVAPWERGPDIAADGLADSDVGALADVLDPADAARLQAIVADPTLAGVDDLATLLAPVVAAGIDEVGAGGAAVTKEDLRAVWEEIESTTGLDQPPDGFIDEGAAAGPPEAAFRFNPIQLIRDGIRATTVLLMKDRAGRVGGTGVAQMLQRLADASAEPRISLAGHSYGAKVMLSALCNGPAPSRLIDSVLLLQPALSCYAFTANLDGRPGGYRPALDRVRLPIITTRSRHDDPLRKFFHLAVRRKSDLAEAVIAAEQPPSKFAALGGYGPQGVDAESIVMPDVGETYPFSTTKRIIAVEGTPFIASHGGVETPQTAWALLSQVRG
ncbi:hypothetical protein GTV32_14195 [Gordonia sp. SID5947]|uniref:hypothetical protein n=1 Tax=Gordonia sp. SID5947 TaxID=2690315 RepID=UPI00136FBDA9|nr:hypothetical protein [Gordonia sp. SID5947]MYR07387.1 hypothetical protein [Gordonia sp. SID5947]